MQQEDRLLWDSDPALRHWCAQLAQLIGLSPPEIEARRTTLLAFCRAHGCAPQQLSTECRVGPGRMERRGHYLELARATAANLIVQSFLIHNGVNVFDDLVCMPSSPEQLRIEQGGQWAGPDHMPTEQSHE